MEWIYENAASLLAGTIVLLAVVLAARTIYLTKKEGKNGCGGGCSCCAMREQCHSNNRKK